MIENLLNEIRDNIYKEYNLPIYINNTQKFKRPSFYVEVKKDNIEENRNIRFEYHTVTIRYFSELSNYNTPDTIKVAKMTDELSKKFKHMIGIHRITDKNFELDAIGDLVITLNTETNVQTFKDKKQLIENVEINLKINDNRL